MNATLHSFRMTEAKAALVHKLVDEHCQALKNWIASAVEQGELVRAGNLVRELREYQELYAAFNMPAKHEIARHSDKPLVYEHFV